MNPGSAPAHPRRISSVKVSELPFTVPMRFPRTFFVLPENTAQQKHAFGWSERGGELVFAELAQPNGGRSSANS